MTNSKIEWTDTTWNPVRGCSMAKGSEDGGCLNCYAARMAARNLPGLKSPSTGKQFARILPSGPRWTGDVELVDSMLDLPLRWRAPKRVFVNSMSDLFHESLPFELIARVFGSMVNAYWHTYQILTKRANRLPEWDAFVRKNYLDSLGNVHFPGQGSGTIKWPHPQIWLGVSIENQETATMRIPLLLQTPAAIRFVSYEPALGPVDLTRINYTAHLRASLVAFTKWSAAKDGDDVEAAAREAADSVSDEGLGESEKPNLNALTGEWFDGWDSGDDGQKLDWIIVGGESGPRARGFDINWARNVVAECKEAGVACFVKQFGAKPREAQIGYFCENDRKKGGDPLDWPRELRVREFPLAGLSAHANGGVK